MGLDEKAFVKKALISLEQQQGIAFGPTFCPYFYLGRYGTGLKLPNPVSERVKFLLK